MSEIENTTADIDNNIQAMPKSTPSKRLSNAERARIESEQLVKALGGSLEGGRRTRSSTRGPIPPSPRYEEPIKRKAVATPRRPKKPKIETTKDEIDGENRIGDQLKTQNAPEKTSSDSGEKTVEAINLENVVETTESIKLLVEGTKPMEIDQSPTQAVKESNENMPSTQTPIDETITIDGDSLNAAPEANNESSPQQNEDKPSVSVAADTTTLIVVEEIENESDLKTDSPIEVINDTIVISSPHESESSQNESESAPVTIVELTDRDSNDAANNESSQIVDLSSSDNNVAEISCNNNNHSDDVEIIQNIVGSTDNDNIVSIVDNDKKSDALDATSVNSSTEEVITTTSETTAETPTTNA